MWGVTLWVKNYRLNRRGAIISEEFNKGVKWHQESLNLKQMIIIELVSVINRKLNTQRKIIRFLSIDGANVLSAVYWIGWIILTELLYESVLCGKEDYGFDIRQEFYHCLLFKNDIRICHVNDVSMSSVESSEIIWYIIIIGSYELWEVRGKIIILWD